ncbi:hypothetical protein BDF21DRAFT_467576 [Thamnidium elegans]|uniref:F-box domain-containing protein n=1 Tax=Thamnidium elegans TaxID=101142 RepID=A0A8H7VZ48_9FUNG|nr:hypothetical protein INT48_006936 [Thamnidium elegans]KAI8058730.1 hypothetical protein BDF21DRAFT_467576 [Thamnidium elegans]
MSSLPYEILTRTFHHLKTKDLLQCQLTDRQWYKVSSSHLYSNIIINTEEKALAYVRTISNSSQLGKYLNIIKFEDMFESSSVSLMFDHLGLLEAVIQYCPNITKIDSYNQDFRFWCRLMYAATQGQLLHLNSLPMSDTDVPAYGTLCNQINQFKKLELLYLNYPSDKYLSYFDGLIDKCQHLKELIFDLDISEILQPNEPEQKIRPRPDIRTFRCNLRLINTERQMEYVMHKFPKLESLEVDYESNITTNCSGPTLIKFIQYAISLPYFNIRFDVSEEDQANIWIEFMKTRNGCKNVSINWSHHPRDSWHNLRLCAEGGISLVFPSSNRGAEPPHVRFLSEAGGSVCSLKVIKPNRVFRITGEDSTTIDWILDIIQLCPLVEGIILCNPSPISPSCRTSKYHSVKKLTLTEVYYTDFNNVLDCLSLNLPNLCKLYLGFGYTDNKNTDPIIINMPHSSLDFITWYDEKTKYDYIRNGDVYIKLKTDGGLRYYSGNKHTLLPVDESRYLLATKNIRFDITCKGLKELGRGQLHPHAANWIF